MERLFYPESVGILGLSSKQNNIARLILENLIRWGYSGRILGINPSGREVQVDGIKMYRHVEELPVVPDCVVALIPAKYVPKAIEDCGKFGVRRMAIPSGGFNELNEEGKRLASQAQANARKYNLRFVGPNGVTVANTANGLCFPFIPSYSPPRGGLSIISQSGGVGHMLWNFMTDDNVGMAKFVSIGNKLDLDEVDFLEYFGRDPETEVIGMYLESITRGKEFIEVASKIDKPILALKAGKSAIGQKSAMSHTAAISNDDDVIDAAFERAGVIRLQHYSECIPVTKAFSLPPMKGNRIMCMSPAGGITVMMADYCEKVGFEMADPGQEFYDGLTEFSNAGVINFSNPLDMGDIYDPKMHAHIFSVVLHNENVDGVAYVTQWPHMPAGGNDVFTKMFNTDLSKEFIGGTRSSQKPMAGCLFGLSGTISKIKQNLSVPLFNTPESMLSALKKQSDYYRRKSQAAPKIELPGDVDLDGARSWIGEREGVVGEEATELLQHFGISLAASEMAEASTEAADIAARFGFPVVLKVASEDAVHKSDVGGVVTDIRNAEDVVTAYSTIEQNFKKHLPEGKWSGVRVAKQVGPGYDMYIGGKWDRSFGSQVYFGYGGIYIEVFRDTKLILCPASIEEITAKVQALQSYKIISGMRGKPAGNVESFVGAIQKVSLLMARFPEIRELDINPVRILEDGTGAIALDARMRIERTAKDC